MDEIGLYNFIKSKKLNIINNITHDRVRLYLDSLGTLSKKPQFTNILSYVIQLHVFLLDHIYVCIGMVISMDRTIIPFIKTYNTTIEKGMEGLHYETDSVFIDIEDNTSQFICISDITYNWDDYKNAIENIVGRALSELCRYSCLYREIEVINRLDKKLPRN